MWNPGKSLSILTWFLRHALADFIQSIFAFTADHNIPVFIVKCFLVIIWLRWSAIVSHNFTSNNNYPNDNSLNMVLKFNNFNVFQSFWDCFKIVKFWYGQLLHYYSNYLHQHSLTYLLSIYLNNMNNCYILFEEKVWLLLLVMILCNPPCRSQAKFLTDSDEQFCLSSARGIPRSHNE